MILHGCTATGLTLVFTTQHKIICPLYPLEHVPVDSVVGCYLFSRPYCSLTLSSLFHFILISTSGDFFFDELIEEGFVPALFYIFLLCIPVWQFQWRCFVQHKKYRDEQCVCEHCGCIATCGTMLSLRSLF